MRTPTRAMVATVLSFMLLVGALAGASLAQEADLDCPDGFVPGVDGENYPVCIEDTDVLDQDLVQEDEDADPDVVSVVSTPEADEPAVEVLGVTLARTGGELVMLLVAGTLLLAAGVGALLLGRRRAATRA